MPRSKIEPADPKPRRVEPRALPIYKFAEMHGIDRSTVWRALRAGKLKAIRIGKQRLILLDSVQPAEDPPSAA
jgi:excisionase family DNA binding protein